MNEQYQDDFQPDFLRLGFWEQVKDLWPAPVVMLVGLAGIIWLAW